MAQTVDNKEERQLIDAVKRAVDLVESGQHPNDAIEKLAREDGFGPGKIRLISHAYNTGRQTSQWNSGGSILDKLASFELADPESVITRIYNGPTPAEKAAAERVHADYSSPPSWLERRAREKCASVQIPKIERSLDAYPKDPMEALHRAYGIKQAHKQAVDELARQASQAEDGVRRHVAALVTYFKKASYARLPFEHVESAAKTYYGAPVGPLMDIVHKQAHSREKRASDKVPVLTNAINLHTEPFTIIRDCIKSAEEVHRCRAALANGREKQAAVVEEVFRPFSKAGASIPQGQPSQVQLQSVGPWSEQAANVFGAPAEKKAGGPLMSVGEIAAGDILGGAYLHSAGLEGSAKAAEPGYEDVMGERMDEIKAIRHQVARAAAKKIMGKEKKAFFGSPAMGAAMGTMLSRGMGSVPKTKDDLIEDAWMDLEDPEHQNELRKIKAHTMLNQMMTDSEDPISGHDPDAILRHYNELSQIAPRATEHPASLRPLLRRRLEGHVEPFETKELTDIEQGIAKSRLPTPNTSLIADAPDKLLG